MEKKKYLVNFSIYFFTILVIIIMMFPIIFIVSNSFSSQDEILNKYTEKITPYNFFDLSNGKTHYINMDILPKVMTLSQYKTLLLNRPVYLRLFWNSVAIVIPIILGQCIISPLGAFAFEQLNFKGKEAVYFVYILIMLMPMQVLLLPHFLISGWLGFRDTWLAIILPAMFRPFGLFLCRQHLKSFPKETIESAKIDGANEIEIFAYIIIPNLKSTLSALTVLTFAQYWNIVDEAVVFIKSPFNEPLSVYLSRVITEDIGMFFAVSCFYLIPAIFVFFLGHKNLVSGIALSGVEN